MNGIDIFPSIINEIPIAEFNANSFFAISVKRDEISKKAKKNSKTREYKINILKTS